MTKIYQAAGGAPPGAGGFPGGAGFPGGQQGSTPGQTSGPHVDEVDWFV
jgi:L1 cell adhesion molecule like protein